MAITSNVTTSYAATLAWNGSIFSNTLSYTVPAGANVLVLRLAGSGGPDGITHNGKALNEVASVNDGDQGNIRIWELLNPDVGTFDLVISRAASSRTYRGFATCLSGVNTGVASTFVTAAVYGTSTSAAVTTTADNFVLDIINIKTTQTATVGAGQTVDATAAASITNYHAYGSTEVATTTSTAMSWTFDISERTSQVAVAYTAAAASTASRNVTNVAAGAVQTFQVMEAGVNTTAGEGLGGSDLVVIEDNHQVTVPLVVSGVTITIGADTLDYQLDQTEMGLAGNSITFDAFYYSPSTEQSSKIAVTVTATASVVSGSMTDWIEANGAGGQVNDAWITYMKGAGASGKTFNDLMFSWLGGLGYTGSLSDRVAAWSKVNLN